MEGKQSVAEDGHVAADAFSNLVMDTVCIPPNC